MSHVIVTGGAGYIGSHACKMLKLNGFTPVTVDNLSLGWREAVKFGPFEYMDLLNKEQLLSIFVKYKPIAVMHFAGLSQVDESIKNPGLYWENNVIGSLNLIQSAVETGCDKFIFSSTCAVYGEQDKVMVNEDSTRFPTSAYGTSKRAIEDILIDYGIAYGLNHVIFRYFNVAGADPEAEIGESHKIKKPLIPLVFEAINGNIDALKIFGTDYNTRDGTCIRDYIHVCDLIDAHILGLNWLQRKNSCRIFNLGSGVGFSVREVINKVEQVTKKRVPTIESPRRPGDCVMLVSNSNRAVKELGWSAARSSLEEILVDAWRWHQKGYFQR